MAKNQQNIEIQINTSIEATKSAKTLEDLKGSIKNLQSQYDKAEFGSKAWKQAGEALDKANEKLQKNQKGLSDLGQAYGKAAQQVPLLSAAQEVLNIVMEANPIGLIVLALTSLAALLSQNAEVMDKLSFVAAGFGKVIRKIADDVVGFGKDLFKAFSDPKQALMDLVEFMKNQVVNRFKAIGLIFQALADRDIGKLTDAILQFNTGIEASKLKGYANSLMGVAKEGYDAAEAIDALISEQAKLEAAMETNNATIEKNKTILADSTKSIKERTQAARNIIALEDDNSKKELQIAEKKLKAEQLRTQGLKLSGEEEANLTKLVAARDKIAAQLEASQRKAKVRLAKLLEGETIKGNTQVVKTEDKLNDDIAKLKEKYTLDERGKLEKKYQDEIDLLKKKGKQEQALIDQIETEKAGALAKFDYDKQLKAQKSEKDEENRIKALNDTQTSLRTQFNKTNDEIDAMYDEIRLANVEMTQEEIYKVIEDRLKAEKELSDKKIAKEKKDGEDEVAREKAKTEAKFLMANQFVDAVGGLTEIVSAIEIAGLKEGTKEYDKAQRNKFNIMKGVQIGSTIISGIEGVINALAAKSVIPEPFGQALKIANAVSIGVASAASIAKIASQQYKGTAGAGAPPPPTTTTNLNAAAGVGISAPQTFGLGEIKLQAPRAQDSWQKVYVVESEIRNTTNKVEVIENRSKLGA